jgi:peptidoglycan/xylan/chitin deacetylase (PgdA/CDA1 family)
MGERVRVGLLVVISVLVAVAVVVATGNRGRVDVIASTTTMTATVTTARASSSTTTTPTSTSTSTAPSTTSTSEPSSTSAVAIRRGPTDRAVVALTFDAGSDAGYASAILDTLRRNGVTASFGITGRWAEANPALVRRMAAEGHQLLNHSWDHPSFTGYSTDDPPLSREERLDQLARAEAAIVAASGVGARPWFRPPFGDEDASVRADVGSAGYRYEVMWTIDSLGWKGLDPAAITQRCLDAAAPGTIYLLHVGAQSADALALQGIIDGLRARGLGFVSLTDLVAS